MAGGQAEARFWQQTPASFAAVMAGVKRRMEREEEDAVSTAHLTARFGRAARLEGLDEYMNRLRAARDVRQKPAAMLAVLMDLAARGGAKMTVRPRAGQDDRRPPSRP